MPIIRGFVMVKAGQFYHGIETIKSEKQADIMSDMANWCVVHTTRYMPRRNSDGTIYIPSTAMATDFNNPRSTVHVTLNHIVRSHGYGSWDDAQIVVLAPYKDVVKKNGSPVEVAGTDTYWSVNPNTGLQLPETAYVVRPDGNGPLFHIGERGATYKCDNYTDEEIIQIESMMDQRDFEIYTAYKNGDLDAESGEVRNALLGDKGEFRSAYDMATDKKAFLRGLFEEARFELLTKCLRNMVVKMSMQKIGKQYVGNIFDGSEKSQIIADVANRAGIASTASNKGHAGSLYMNFEEFWQFEIHDFMNGGKYNRVPGILTTDAKSFYDVFLQHKRNSFFMAVFENVTENKPIDFMSLYEGAYRSAVDMQISSVMGFVQEKTVRLSDYENNIYGMDEETKNKYVKYYKDLIEQGRNFIEKMSAKKTIADYDKNLAETLRRNSERLSASYNVWREKLAKDSEFENLVKKLRALGWQQNVIQSVYQNY